MMFLAFLFGLTVAGSTPQVDLHNEVSACLKLDNQRVLASGSFLVLSANGTFIKSTGECGCTSALLEYNVSSGSGERRLELVRALVSAKPPRDNQRPFEFLLQSDSRLPHRSPLTLVVRCAPDK
jgi:hypothetical protein